MLFETNPVDLRELIAKAKSGLIQLPDFQRGWVWDDERIAALLVTVARGYPLGVMMAMETGNPDLEFRGITVRLPRPENDRQGPGPPPRLVGRDPASGQVTWSAPFGLPRRYLADHATLAYATTAHAALGRTTDTAHVLVDGLADRQGLYVAMSRGRRANFAYCITHSPRLADPAEGTRRAPELDRAARLARERSGIPPPPATADRTADQATVLDPVTVLAQIMARDGTELPATETLERELANADHLGVLGGIWDDVTRPAHHARYEAAPRQALPDDQAEEALSDAARTWLWRTLREAEAAGLDASAVVTKAVAARTMTGARDVAGVLDSRIRRSIKCLPPQPPGPWASRVPDTTSPEINRYLRELAETMDDRTRRLGEHTAIAQPLWARQAPGPVPDDPTRRLEWEHRASVIAAYRERYGHNHPADPIGPEPATTSPETRAAWNKAGCRAAATATSSSTYLGAFDRIFAAAAAAPPR